MLKQNLDSIQLLLQEKICQAVNWSCCLKPLTACCSDDVELISEGNTEDEVYPQVPYYCYSGIKIYLGLAQS